MKRGTIGIESVLWMLMAWCFITTRASANTMLANIWLHLQACLIKFLDELSSVQSVVSYRKYPRSCSIAYRTCFTNSSEFSHQICCTVYFCRLTHTTSGLTIGINGFEFEAPYQHGCQCCTLHSLYIWAAFLLSCFNDWGQCIATESRVPFCCVFLMYITCLFSTHTYIYQTCKCSLSVFIPEQDIFHPLSTKSFVFDILFSTAQSYKTWQIITPCYFQMCNVLFCLTLPLHVYETVLGI